MANIIFLADAVLPHHHHEKEVCFVDSHCQTDSEAHKHETGKHNHEQHATKEHSHDHDGNTESQNCLLKQEVILPSNQIDLECKSFDYVDNTNFNGFQANLINSELDLQNQENFSIKIPPLISSFYSRIASTSKGLRAPPIV